MRARHLILPLWSLLSLLLLWVFRPVGEAVMEDLIPEDILALAVITDPPSDLDFLRQTRLAAWLNVDPEAGLVRELAGALPVFSREVRKAWLIVHALEHRADDRWRLHFTLLLIPRTDRAAMLEEQIASMVWERFGAGTVDVVDRDSVRIYTGKEPGEILYQVRTPDYLMLSNSQDGWEKMLGTELGTESSLADNLSFQKVRSRLAGDAGLFLYVRSGRLLPMLPEFGYSLRWAQGGDRERFVEVDGGPLTTDN